MPGHCWCACSQVSSIAHARVLELFCNELHVWQQFSDLFVYRLLALQARCLRTTLIHMRMLQSH